MPSTGHSKIAALEAACRAEGLPLTVQRRTILEVLAERTDHPTADQVFAAVRRRMPDVSRTTVYRVLDTLVRLGLAVKTPHPGAAVRFDPRTERHHHLVCNACDRVIDLHAPELDTLELPDMRRLGFEADDYSLHIRGLCADCRSARRATRRRPRVSQRH
ncbi:MAG TPA: transcriptional repressor [Candidatus Limnocylindria bacterium]|nr:transcriptional repressor [Candidatus Limnocylindria bacterium]